MSRRSFLGAMGLGGLALGAGGVGGGLFGGSHASAGAWEPPRRVVFFITPHGTSYEHFKLPLGGDVTTPAQHDLRSMTRRELPAILQPLDGFQHKLLVMEGVARTSALVDEQNAAALNAAHRGSADANRHDLAQAHLLTCALARQPSGTGTCTGGAQSVDQFIGGRMPTAWSSRVWGPGYGHGYSFVRDGVGASRVSTVAGALRDFGTDYVPVRTGAPDRAERLRLGRGRALARVASTFAGRADQLPHADAMKLEAHRELLTSLQRRFGPMASSSAPACHPDAMVDADPAIGFAQLTALALSCDMTRVVTYVADQASSASLGLGARDIHTYYAHNSEPAPDDGGGTYTAEAGDAMRLFNQHYAQQFARFLHELDQVPEGDAGESLLDHTAVVWLTELGTGTHQLHDCPVVIGGGMKGAIATGRYVRLGMPHVMRSAYSSRHQPIGRSISHLHVSLLQAMGIDQDHWGMTSARDAAGGTIDLTGPMTELVG